MARLQKRLLLRETLTLTTERLFVFGEAKPRELGSLGSRLAGWRAGEQLYLGWLPAAEEEEERARAEGGECSEKSLGHAGKAVLHFAEDLA
ncbi:hypothetical protein AAFF_G00376700 [Aldrovandia affinis]|uniref:Uncharacterized protein n=1 Tax=Aldrovandia affinis TaxID=143900 RepID=A0AAD7WMQ0_9TELE|nr:hypothetical protein AAFF_G00376700 [Aldrovandia affinis]